MVKTRCEHNSTQQHKKSLKRGWLWGAVQSAALTLPSMWAKLYCIVLSFCHSVSVVSPSTINTASSSTQIPFLVCITNLIQNCSFFHEPWTLPGSILLCEEPFLGHRGTNIGCPPGGRLKCRRAGPREGE